jgi:steroid delta-isomerase-like uncharacterized protein
MSAEENKAVVRRFITEVIAGGNMALTEELVAPNYVNYSLPPGAPPGVEGLTLLLAMLRAGVPDIQFPIEDLIAEGDKVVARYTVQGTHRGDFQGIPPTGKQIALRGLAYYRLEGGKIAEDEPIVDQFSLLQQLGALPAPGAGGQ